MNKIRKLSIVVPVFNEEKTIEIILKKIDGVDLGGVKKELILVNDGSSDGTLKVLYRIQKERKNKFTLVSYKSNMGKSWALRSGFKKVTGDAVVVQDGDLEYNPNDFKIMLKELNKKNVRVVYGSRRLNKSNVQYSGLGFYLGGLSLTYLVNILYGGNITDEPTCYKMFETKLLKSIPLKSSKFEFCPEVTAKVLKRRIKIAEVPISYNPRHVDQGKKIKLKDFFEAVWVLIKYRFIE